MSDKDSTASSPRRSRSPSPSRSRSHSPSPRDDEASASAAARRERSQSPEPKDAARRSRSRSPEAAKAPAKRGDVANPGNNLYVANLAARVSEADLQELFAKFGRVDKSEVILDPVTKESRGFGFVTFEDVRDAEDAVKEMNGKEIQGRTIRVEHAKRKRGHEKTPGQYLGPRLASAKYGRDRERGGDRSRDRGRRSRSRDRGGYARRDDRDRGRYDDRGRGRNDDRDRGRFDDRDRGRGGYDRDSFDDRRSRR